MPPDPLCWRRLIFLAKFVVASLAGFSHCADLGLERIETVAGFRGQFVYGRSILLTILADFGIGRPDLTQRGCFSRVGFDVRAFFPGATDFQ
jgi:hypothetical protein